MAKTPKVQRIKKKILGQPATCSVTLQGKCVQSYAKSFTHSFIFVHGESFNQEESVISWQYAGVVVCV